MQFVAAISEGQDKQQPKLPQQRHANGRPAAPRQATHGEHLISLQIMQATRHQINFKQTLPTNLQQIYMKIISLQHEANVIKKCTIMKNIILINELVSLRTK